MIHSMNLAPSPFEMIASGKKTIEVIRLHPFKNFASLYETLPLLSCGYTASTIQHAHPDDMRMYYSKEEEDTYGVVGIELKLITEK